VATGDRVRAELEVARGEVVVGVAEARRGHSDEQLTWTWIVEIDVGDLPLAR
jgi:hypothetical protein